MKGHIGGAVVKQLNCDDGEEGRMSDANQLRVVWMRRGAAAGGHAGG